MENSLSYNRKLKNFPVGQKFDHWPGKTITESDNNLFCLLTMNHHPVHLDSEYAQNRQHGKRLVVGTYVLSLVVGMTVSDISGAAIANLGYNKVIHHNPVFINDTLYAKSEVLDIQIKEDRPDRGIVKVRTEAFNQNKEIVLSFERSVLIPEK